MCEHLTTLLARRTPFKQSLKRSSLSHTTIKQKSTEWCFLALWSKCGGSNSGPHGPECRIDSFCHHFPSSWHLSSQKTMLSTPLVNTVSTQSTPVYGLHCGQTTNQPQKPHPVYDFLSHHHVNIQSPNLQPRVQKPHTVAFFFFSTFKNCPAVNKEYTRSKFLQCSCRKLLCNDLKRCIIFILR